MKIYPGRRISLGPFVDMHLASLANLFLNITNQKIAFKETPTFEEAAKSEKIIEMALLSSREENRTVYSSEFE
jgi:hypothetical protein